MPGAKYVYSVTLFLTAFLVPASAQPVTCNTAPPVPLLVRSGGGSELVADAVMVCNDPGPGSNAFVNFTLTLSVPLTSHITNIVTQATDVLLLIDEPQPNALNFSNGFFYFGQVLGTPGVAAGDPGSGNVYQGTLTNSNQVTFFTVPYHTVGTHTFRIVNARGNVSLLPPPSAIKSDISVNGPITLTINLPQNIVAYVQDGLVFSASTPTPPHGRIDLKFGEGFASAFKKRIENTNGGPLTAVNQDVPGQQYCTESGLNPQFSGTTPGDIGAAFTGTRLLAQFAGLSPGTHSLLVPNEVISSTGELIAHRVLPPFNANFTGGTVTTATGNSVVTVSAHAAEVLYEVTAAPPFAGQSGCFKIENFTIQVQGSAPVAITPSMVTGRFAPVDGTASASATAPSPRFVP